MFDLPCKQRVSYGRHATTVRPQRDYIHADPAEQERIFLVLIYCNAFNSIILFHYVYRLTLRVTADFNNIEVSSQVVKSETV